MILITKPKQTLLMIFVWASRETQHAVPFPSLSLPIGITTVTQHNTGHGDIHTISHLWLSMCFSLYLVIHSMRVLSPAVCVSVHICENITKRKTDILLSVCGKPAVFVHCCWGQSHTLRARRTHRCKGVR